MPPKKKPSGAEKTGGKKKKQSQPTQVNPKGQRVKVIGRDGKVRWEWQKKSG